MKTVIVVVVAIIGSFQQAVHAQELYFTKNGHITFFSSTPLEDIKAENDKVTSIINLNTGEIEFSVLIMAFQFEKALMQEHFNENYMESSKFPKAVFKGKVQDHEKINFKKDGTYPVKVEGEITIHGVTRQHLASGTFLVKDGQISASSEFNLSPADFDIEIPNLVKDNIAKEIKVTVENNYQIFKKG